MSSCKLKNAAKYSVLVLLGLLPFLSLVNANVVSYDPLTNTVTAIGGSSSSSITFNTLYSDVSNESVINETSPNTYLLNCKLVIGDGLNSTYFNATGTQVFFSNSVLAGNSSFLTINSNTTLFTENFTVNSSDVSSGEVVGFWTVMVLGAIVLSVVGVFFMLFKGKRR